MDERLEKLAEKAKSLPKAPGVYLMKDSAGRVIYIGKSASLRDRVSSYFQPATKLERKKAGLSQEDLAFRADLHRTEVSLIERGLREPRLETFLKLSRGLGVKPATLIDGIN